jgi:expansin (peptidoglycan-binding protein)
VLVLAAAALAATACSHSAGGPPTTASCSDAATVYDGHATWYTATGTTGACLIPFSQIANGYYAAMNEADYNNAAACGTCVRVSYGGKTLDMEIVDECPYAGNEQWCYPGGHHLDMGPDAFSYFAPESQGVLAALTWSYVPCDVTGPLEYTFKAQDSQYWAEVLVTNYPYQITDVEVEQPDGTYMGLVRQTYNEWQAASGLGSAGPFTFRVTDIYGAQVVDKGIAMSPGNTVDGTAPNFPLCSK